jgi:hypothetical protein
MSKDGIASGFAFGYDLTSRSVLFKIDRSTKDSRQAEFICSTFDLPQADKRLLWTFDAYSPPQVDPTFISFSVDLNGCF